MEVQIRAKDFKVSQGLREYIEERIAKLDRFVGRGADAKLELTHEHPRTGGERITAQLTIAARHTLLRAEEQHADARQAIDLALDKMMNQIRRYHNKRTDHKRASVAEFVGLPPLEEADLAALDAAPDGDDVDGARDVVRTKRFPLKPMSSGEAIDQLELLGHDFYVFLNAEDNQVNVIYRRKGGAYGLIQPA